MEPDEVKYDERSFPPSQDLDLFYRRWDRNLRMCVPLEEHGGREDQFGAAGTSTPGHLA